MDLSRLNNQEELLAINIRNLTKSFDIEDGQTLHILQNLDLDVHFGESVAVIGPSGSGKTTLLQILGMIDLPNKINFQYHCCGTDISSLTSSERQKFIAKNLGFIHQNYNLITDLTALENVAIPLILNGLSSKQAKIKALEMLKEVDMDTKANFKPFELSGGQQQRIGIARAFISQPKIIIADEPTGNLDFKTAEIITQKIFQKAKESNAGLIIVTHNAKLAQRCDKIFQLEEGKLRIYSTSSPNLADNLTTIDFAYKTPDM